MIRSKVYKKDNLRHIAFPLGGIGAGMICIQGSGMLANFSIKNTPDIHLEPNVFSAICVKKQGGNIARVIEGQVPYHKIFGHPTVGEMGIQGMGNGLHGKNYGLPRFSDNDFSSRFPFAELNFYDDKIPLKISVNAWSPFIPLNEDDSSLPAAILEYNFMNETDTRQEAVYTFNAQNFLAFGKKNVTSPDEHEARVYRNEFGFTLHQPRVDSEITESWFIASVDDKAYINADWYDGGWFDKLTMLWKDIENQKLINASQEDNKSPGGSISVPFALEPGENKTIILKLTWYTPESSIRKGFDEHDACNDGCCSEKEGYKPWYSGRFSSAGDVMDYVNSNLNRLKSETQAFTDTLYNCTLPEEIIDAVSSNLSILKSPTILRQTDGRMWAWEGCCDTGGCCYGSCTHVWNYAQAICHLFPVLERSLRKTEFNESQDENGHQTFRSSIPIRPAAHDFHAAADGQLGGIMKVHREWRISGDTKWMASYWEKVKASLDYCIRTWDKKGEGVLKEPHHNTYDIEFWGADGMCSSF
ncbi:MAG: GH116 family glycosyl-hydrolase, partial [Clostridia bacterium]|nr:GH116 family glycosyl-hydrolase [Clostridia bacterium]